MMVRGCLQSTGLIEVAHLRGLACPDATFRGACPYRGVKFARRSREMRVDAGIGTEGA